MIDITLEDTVGMAGFGPAASCSQMSPNRSRRVARRRSKCHLPATMCFPAHALQAEFKGARIPLADPVQMIWDLHDLGGGDRAEAAGKLRQWLLER